MGIRIAIGIVCAIASGAEPARAGDPTRLVTLRWSQPAGPAPEGLLVLTGPSSGIYNQILPIDPPAEVGGVASFSLPLPARHDVYVALIAHNQAGYSDTSNERLLPAIALPPPDREEVIALGHAHPRERVPLVGLDGELFESGEVGGPPAGEHVAWCDLDGDALPELLLGQDGTGAGQTVIVSATGALRAVLGGSGSGTARPACGDLDGDGRDEIVVGLDVRSGAWIQVFDDASAFFAPLRLPGLDAQGRLPRNGWHGRAGAGAVQPALGDLDGDGRAEVVLALDRDGGGWVRVLDDAQAGLAPLELGAIRGGWLQATGSDRAVWPALGDADGDGRDELVFGFDDPGRLRILDDPLERSEEGLLDGWLELPEARASGADLHPALGDLDQDGRAELVLGFEGALAHSLLVLTDLMAGSLPHPGAPAAGWIDVAGHDLTGPVFPAVRRRRIYRDTPPILLGHGRLGSELALARVDGRLETLDAGGLASGLPAQLAWCDINGDGHPELVAGQGPGGGGILRLAFVGEQGVTNHFDLPVGPSDYGEANGELRPACGDLDGDGRDELVAGPGPGGNGEVYVRDDAYRGLAPWAGLPGGALRWIRWPSYLMLGGEARPAAGDLDGDGRDELVIGLGPGGQGWLYILDDASTGFAPMSSPPLAGGWLQWTSDAGYLAASGGAWPVLGDVDGDGRDEIAIGSDAGGGGRVVLLDDALAGFAPLVGTAADPGIHIPTSGDGATYPALLDVDGDGRDELVVGFGPGDPRLYVADDALAGFVPHPHTPRRDGFVSLAPLGLVGPVVPARGAP